ncbi:MAG TPA: glycosyltransferase, partial [Gemmatimonadaceae bacterium]
LKMAGRGKDADAVEKMARDLGIERNVKMLGAVSDSDRDALLSGALIQLMPSRFEGFGLAAAEAMAAGVPLIASSAGSLPEVVDAPRGGVLVPPGDADALAAAADDLLSDETKREALSNSARESARRFRWSAVADAHLKFINNVAATA